MRNANRTLSGAILATMVGLALLGTPAAAASGPDGGADDLGLDGLQITATTVTPRTGLATVTGEVICSQDLQDVYVDIHLQQVVGRFNVVDGGGSTVLDCGAAEGSAPFSMDIAGWGKFAPGSATLWAYAEVSFCIETPEEFGCFYDDVAVGPATVRLTR